MVEFLSDPELDFVLASLTTLVLIMAHKYTYRLPIQPTLVDLQSTPCIGQDVTNIVHMASSGAGRLWIDSIPSPSHTMNITLALNHSHQKDCIHKGFQQRAS